MKNQRFSGRLSPKVLRAVLRCDLKSGKLFWRERPAEMFTEDRYWKRWNTIHAGREAFTSVDNRGYRQGAIFGIRQLSHRVIWAMVHDEWPADEIDHINGDRADNRIVNLRAVTRAENALNRKCPSNNSSGVVGVNWDKKLGKWQAKIGHYGRRYGLGYFSDFSEACAARAAAEAKYGFHENHGRPE